MKKVLTLTIVFILTLTMLSADALAALEPDDVIGTWYLNTIEREGVVMSPTSYDLEVTMILNENNTVFLQSTWIEDTTGTWILTVGEVILSSDEQGDLVFTLVDGSLFAEENGMKMIFGKEKIEFVNAVRSDAALLDFNGTWGAYFADLSGVKQPIDASRHKCWLVIDNGKVAINMFGRSIQLEGEVSAGALTMTWVGGVGKEMPISFNLHEDGTVSGIFRDSEKPFTLYYQKTGE